MARKARPHGRALARERRKHAAKIGQLTIIWNMIHLWMQVLYGWLGAVNGNAAPGIREWALITSDYTQRGLLLERATNTLQNRPELLAEVVWLIGWLDTLSEMRNAFVHLPVSYKILPPLVHVELGGDVFANPKYDRVRRRPAETYTAVRRDLEKLAGFGLELFRHFLQPARYAMPARPDIRTASVFANLAPRVRP